MKLEDLATPQAVLDKTRLSGNLARMQARAQALGVALRPHLKTAKSAEVARLATGAQQPAITVSTTAEARYFAARDVRDITYAVAATPGKLDALAGLRREGVEVGILVDSIEAARLVSARAGDLGCRFDVLIEIDCGAHRGGVPEGSPLIVEIGRILDAGPSTRLAGVLTHAGHSYRQSTTDDIAAVAEQERLSAVGAAAMLREAGLSCRTVSVGSTPTALFARSLDGVTEMRPGVYMFFDRFQHHLGCCAADDLALSVLATVIGLRRDLGYALIDAGALALSHDTCMAAIDGRPTYGAVFDVTGRARIGDLAVTAAHQEHGFVASASDAPDPPLPAIGTRLRIFPNHACMTAAPYAAYAVVEGDRVIGFWDKATGW